MRFRSIPRSTRPQQPSSPISFLLRQIWTLTLKNFLVIFVRHWKSTLFRAFILPCAFTAFLTFTRFLFYPPGTFGIGTPSPIIGFTDALGMIKGGRDRLIFVDNGFSGGQIRSVINDVVVQTGSFGKDVRIYSDIADLVTTCRGSFRGTSRCIGAAVFHSSPTEGQGGKWNYTLRADGILGTSVYVDKTNNDPQLYVLPFQRAIDNAIAKSQNATSLSVVEQFPYTTVSSAQRSVNQRTTFMNGIINILAVAFFIGMIPVTYQQVGLIATERELGMAQLLDAMMPNAARWQPQWVRILANHLAFDIMFGPGWLVMALILVFGVFTQTNAAITIFTNLFAGLALSSFSILGGAFFHKAQLSGISTTIIWMVLAIISQVIGATGTVATAVLSLLFTPMNYVYTLIYIAHWEHNNLGARMLRANAESKSKLPLLILWVFLWIQIIVYPILGAWVERTLYGTASKTRKTQISDEKNAITITGFTKRYPPTVWRRFWCFLTRKTPKTVVAVSDLTLISNKGEIMVLLGANGSGKSTTLDAVAGLHSITSGGMLINYPESGTGLGLCPQKNVLWDDLTVAEHVWIFNKIKSNVAATKDENTTLLRKCDISFKARAKSKTLSGGQKRKVQLAMMFTGGSRVCCVDEVSSGLDPISRRKIWDILLAERGYRSIILTTHFLDEADLLADHIAILSKGLLKCTGTSVELKHNLGSGYRVHAFHQTQSGTRSKVYDSIQHVEQDDRTIYYLGDSASTTSFLAQLENDGITEYQVSGPTIEDVFLKVADEVATEVVKPTDENGDSSSESANNVVVVQAQMEVPQLLDGTRISVTKQALVLFGKRLVILRRNMFPYIAALLIPILAAGLVTLFLIGFTPIECTPVGTISEETQTSMLTFAISTRFRLLVGPRSRVNPQSFQLYGNTYAPVGNLSFVQARLASAVTLVDDRSQFNNYLTNNYANVTPGGIYLGDTSTNATIAWRGNSYLGYAAAMQNLMNVLLTNVSIGMQYQILDLGRGDQIGKSLQLVIYFGLAMSIAPAMFGLYPTIERRRKVRPMHYSNGVRPAPLWLAYTTFDFIIILVSTAIVVAVFVAVTNVWYNIGFLFIVLFLYGLASILLAYLVSLFTHSQLSTFAFAAGSQAVMLLLYFVAFLSVLTYAPLDKIDDSVIIVQYVLGLILPISNLARAMCISLNVLQVTCTGQELRPYAGDMAAYGSPILYLILQIVVYFTLLLWLDSGPIFQRFRGKSKDFDNDDQKYILDAEAVKTTEPTTQVLDGLRVSHLSKQYKKNLAVDNVSFDVPRGEVFALLGPNGAGKSTTISLIRGDIRPSIRGGDILVDDISIIRNRAKARSRLGVCPQFDAMDTMTVEEHLHFYAKVRGIAKPKHNVQAVIRAVGLELFKDRMAGRLSGGNKRKLSLGIALMGNPTVLLLDEPSSGMDAASKRVMWRTLASTVPGRALVLTTHSMEEADALASRAGIMAGRMLAMGSTDWLRREHGNSYYVHVVHRDAPHTQAQDMQNIRDWILRHFPDVTVEDKIYAGQLRFSVPVVHTSMAALPNTGENRGDDTDMAISPVITSDAANKLELSSSVANTTIAPLFAALEHNRERLEILYYSVSRATLDQVFLSIVGKHNVAEEGHGQDEEVENLVSVAGMNQKSRLGSIFGSSRKVETQTTTETTHLTEEKGLRGGIVKQEIGSPAATPTVEKVNTTAETKVS